MSEISFQYPIWFIGFCILLGLVYATMLYFRSRKFTEAPQWLVSLLFILRFLTVTALSLLLLAPFITSIRTDIKEPIVVIMEDASSSITNSPEYSGKIYDNNSLDQLAENLNEKFDVRRYQFGDRVIEGKIDSFWSKSTDLSVALSYIEDNYADQNLGAVVMATDGVFNLGTNPIYNNYKFNSAFYSVALGDTTPRRDLLVKNVFANNIAYLGDKFSIQVDIMANELAGRRTTLSVSKIINGQSQKLWDKSVTIRDNDFFETLVTDLDASSAGLNHFRVAVTSIDGENITANNSRDFYVEVLDARQKILILGRAPHPDLAAVKSMIDENKNYEAEIKLASESINVRDYNLLIFHDLPSRRFPLDELITSMNTQRLPRIFVLGGMTDLSSFNNVQDAVNIAGNSDQTNEVTGVINSSFSQYDLDYMAGQSFKRYPPLLSRFGSIKAVTSAKVLMYQRIKKVDTEYPLIAFHDAAGIKTGVLAGEGIWKWKLFDFLQNGNSDLVTESFNKMVQFVSIKEDKRKFRVTVSKTSYDEQERIFFEGQLYNNAYEQVNDPDVPVVIKSENGDEFPFTMSRKGNYYILNAGSLNPGNYSFSASTTFSAKKYNAYGKFSIKNAQLEGFDLVARHSILHSLSDKYGGKVFSANKLTQLESDITGNTSLKPVSYASTETRSLLDKKWIFFLLLSLLSFEWILRRYFGSY